MVSKSAAIILLVFCAGCQQQSAPIEKHRARIAVAESFCFAIMEPRADTHDSALPPARVKPAGGGALLSAPQPLPSRRHLFGHRRRRAKHH